MSEMAIKVAVVDGERRQAVVELWRGEEPLGHIRLPALALERLIHRLSECRALLEEEVPRKYEEMSAPAGVVIEPTWSVLTQPGERTKILALRHPGLGWLPFVLPEHQQLTLAKVLAAEPPSETAH